MPAEAILSTLRYVWLTLEPLKSPMAIIGGIALAAWKYVRATKDIDILLAIEKRNTDRVLEVLQAAGIHPKRNPPVTTLGQLDVIQLVYEPPEAFMDVQIDLLLAKLPYHQEALRRRVFLTLPDLDFDVAVLTCEDLILHKLLAGRIIDRADAVELARLNRSALDLAYLENWTRNLRLASEWAEVRQGVFPGNSTG